MKRVLYIFLLASALTALFSSCGKDDFGIPDDPSPRTRPEERSDENIGRDALILYSAGFNNLASSLDQDIQELASGYVPTDSFYEDGIFIISRSSQKKGYSVSVPTYIIRMYTDMDGKVQLDTLHALPDAIAASSLTMNTALNYIKDNFGADRYGMIFSSHASGWLPPGYFTSSTFIDLGSGPRMAPMAASQAGQYSWPVFPGPLTKSIGQDEVKYPTTLPKPFEMPLEQFTEAIPMHMDYIIFDACLMGGVEVAYSLKDKVDLIAFSPAEILSTGFDYTKLGERVFKGDSPDIKGACQDYFDYYKDKSGDEGSATVSIAISSHMQELADVCKKLIEAHASDLEHVDPFKVQRYYRHNSHWFFDLEDYFLKAGISSSEADVLHNALSKAVITSYETTWHTDSFMPTYGGFRINHYSGLSTFIPMGEAKYTNAYRDTKWNKAVGLVK